MSGVNEDQVLAEELAAAGGPGQAMDVPGKVAVLLRRVLAAVDAGELAAETDQVAYLTGAADVLDLLTSGVPEPSFRDSTSSGGE